MINLRINKRIVYFNESSKKELISIRNYLSYLSPDRFYSPMFHKRRSNGDRVWNGKIEFFSNPSRSFSVGFLQGILEHLSKEGHEVKLEDQQYNETDWIKFGDNFLDDERDYQRNAIEAFIKHGYGVIKVPTRGGKTYILAETMRLLTERHEGMISLFVTDGVDIMHQNIDDIAQVMGILPEDIGVIQGDTVELKQVNVAMVQTIQSLLKKGKKGKRLQQQKDFVKFIKKVNFFATDEIQDHLDSSFRHNLPTRFKKAEYIMGISATPFDLNDDGGELAEMYLKKNYGGIVYDIKESDLVQRGVLAESKVIMIVNNKTGETRGEDYSDSKTYKLLFNEHRNDILLNCIEVCVELNYKTLVLFSSVEQGEMFSEVTEIKFLYGETDKEERERGKREFLEMDGGILFASDIWKKGITLPSVEVTILAGGGKGRKVTKQKRGRALGSTDKKDKAIHIDIFDDMDDAYFLEHSINRLEAYEDQYPNPSENIIMMEEFDRKEFKNIVKEWLKKE